MADLRGSTPADREAAEEYRRLFLSQPCDRIGCPNAADGDLTHFCRKHEDEHFRSERAFREEA